MIFLIFAISAQAGELKISRVIVLDSSFQQIRVIDQPEQIKYLNDLWKNLKPIEVKDLPNTNWTHKLDIKSNGSTARWLYNQEGYLAKLNYQLKPIYKVVNLEAFNKLIFGY
jgi:hypothetical protein